MTKRLPHHSRLELLSGILRRDNSEEPNLIAALERITSFDNNWGIRIGGHVLHSAGSLPAEKPFHLL